ncbi:hypothetical protein BDN72DRAFT_286126 [Pluteus cervinus]|uniref:Uncharacterized protein n=1 Tax=Pluteus cervinus TaxID=181527 RepID=A0ACD3AEJ5_9AGAR|nr:hypothetical protein BDN72DRAFT_286126 [Pluteus cervinus]
MMWQQNPTCNGFMGPLGLVLQSGLAKWIAEHCEKKHQLAASFLFFRGDQDTNHTGKFIPPCPTKLRFPRLFPALLLIKLIEHDPTIMAKSFKTQWEKLVLAPLASANQPVLIVIDGIDELVSVGEQVAMLRCICDVAPSLSSGSVRILLFSRPEAHIREEIDKINSDIINRIELGASEEDEADVRTFLELSFAQIRRRCVSQIPSPWPPPAILDKLVEMADRQFIYATILLAFVDNQNESPVTNLNLVLQGHSSTFRNLDHLYLTIMKKARDETPRERGQLLHDLLATDFLQKTSLIPVHSPCLAVYWSIDPTLVQIMFGRLESVLSYGKVGVFDVITLRHRSFIDFTLNPSLPHPFVINHASFATVLHRFNNPEDPGLISSNPEIGRGLWCKYFHYWKYTMPTPTSIGFAAFYLASCLRLKPLWLWPPEDLASGVRSTLDIHREFIVWMQSWVSNPLTPLVVLIIVKLSSAFPFWVVGIFAAH